MSNGTQLSLSLIVLPVRPETRWWLTIAVVFVLSLPAVTPRLYSSDEIQYFVYLRSMWFDHDLSFDNDYRYFYDRGIAQGARPREDGSGLYGDRFFETFLAPTTATGLRPNLAPMGCALLWAPFYAVADVTARLMAFGGSSIAVDGFSRPYLVAVTYGSASYGFLAILLSIVIARRLLGAGYLAGCITWVGTPLLFYMYVAPGMSHAVSAFTVATFVYVWLRVRPVWSMPGCIALGALAAVMAMVREQDVFVAAGPVVDFLTTISVRARLRSPSVKQLGAHAAAGVAAFVVAYLPQIATYVVLNGRPGPPEVVGQKMVWTAPFALPVLFSAEHGLFVWTPLAAIGVMGLIMMARGAVEPNNRQARWFAQMLLLVFLSQVYISGSVTSWSAAGTFGHRRFVGLTVVLAVGVATFIAAMRKRWQRSAAVTLIALSVWWNVSLMAQFGAGIMNRQRLELSRNVYDSFITVPRLVPTLLYRYLFDRESFYSSRSPKAAPTAARPDPEDAP